ncbi:MAG: CarD family transcriptional regulator [Acidobacteria bacterium]|nr:CarD family transcriptional regulator [Acidobacteriota bacterium]
MRFKIGDKVVYPNHGIGIVKEIRDLSYGGENSTFISLQILSTDSIVMVPVQNSKAVGLRKLVSRARVRGVLEKLRDAEVDIPQDWKGRYQENQEKMRSGDIEQVAEVLKNLTFLNKVKTLSYRERKMLDRARSLVVTELAEASHQPVQKVEIMVNDAMSDVLEATNH